MNEDEARAQSEAGYCAVCKHTDGDHGAGCPNIGGCEEMPSDVQEFDLGPQVTARIDQIDAIYQQNLETIAADTKLTAQEASNRMHLEDLRRALRISTELWLAGSGITDARILAEICVTVANDYIQTGLVASPNWDIVKRSKIFHKMLSNIVLELVEKGVILQPGTAQKPRILGPDGKPIN